MRRLPVYFLLDTSGSMRGEPIQAVNKALSALLASLRCYPEAMEALHLSVILFNKEPTEILPLTKLDSATITKISCPSSSPTYTGKALELLIKTIAPQLAKRRLQSYLHHKPLIFLVTDGKASDIYLYKEMTSIVSSSEYGIKIGCAISNEADINALKTFSNTIIKIATADFESINQFMEWCKELILSIINDDSDIFDSSDILNPDKPILPKLHGRLLLIN